MLNYKISSTFWKWCEVWRDSERVLLNSKFEILNRQHLTIFSKVKVNNDNNRYKRIARFRQSWLNFEVNSELISITGLHCFANKSVSKLFVICKLLIRLCGSNWGNRRSLQDFAEKDPVFHWLHLTNSKIQVWHQQPAYF